MEYVTISGIKYKSRGAEEISRADNKMRDEEAFRNDPIAQYCPKVYEDFEKYDLWQKRLIKCNKLIKVAEKNGNQSDVLKYKYIKTIIEAELNKLSNSQLNGGVQSGNC